MSFRMHVTILLVFFLLGGCATSYHPRDMFGRGYSEMALQPDVYIVSFSGNGYTSQEIVQSNLLRRCADLTLSRGYHYFILAEGNTSVDTAIMQTPTTVSVNSFGNYQGFGSGEIEAYGNRGYGHFNVMGSGYSSSYATIHPGTQYRINKYTTRVVIKMLKSNRHLPQALDAKVILSNFEGK